MTTFSFMKTKNGLTYIQVAVIALVTELTLIAIQLVYLKIYTKANPGAEVDFSSDYMKTRGFYIFQIIGFFLYTFVVYITVGKIASKIFNKLLVLIITGAIVELSFYIIMKADYEGAFLYSILDKVIAASFGLILYNYTTKKVKKPDSYL